MSGKLALVVLLTSSFLSADGGHQHGPVKGEKLGKVHFPISCGPQAQAAFDRGMAMLHSFWFEKATETFTQLASAHPDCAMAHWGVAMSYFKPLWAPPTQDDFAKGAVAVENARTARKTSAREKRYIEAIAAFYAEPDKYDHLTRKVHYEKAMEKVHAADPKDSEAAILYSLALAATADPKDKTFANQRKCGETLEPIFAKQQQHPGLAHYIIHCYDNPVLAPQGLKAARAYAKIAPSVPHAQHMPSHIFTRLGLWDEAIASNTGAADAGRQFEREMKMARMWAETAHAFDYKHYALLQQGRVNDAQKIVDTFKAEAEGADLNVNQMAYGSANVFARHALETQDWQAAAALKPQNSKYRDADALVYMARGMGNARSGNVDAARKDVAALVEIERSLTDPYWKGQAEIKRLEAEAWFRFAEGSPEQGLQLARDAAAKEDATDKNPVTPGALIPAHEVIADLLFESKDYAGAAQEYQESLKTSPKRFHALYGAARSAELAGDIANAKKHYQELLEVAAKGDDTERLRAAKKFVSGAEVAAK